MYSWRVKYQYVDFTTTLCKTEKPKQKQVTIICDNFTNSLQSTIQIPIYLGHIIYRIPMQHICNSDCFMLDNIWMPMQHIPSVTLTVD